MRGDVTVVAGGWSVRELNLERLPGLVIGVNDSGLLLPRCDIALSMDRTWSEHRALLLAERRQYTMLRRSAIKNVTAWPELGVFECDHTSGVMSDEEGVLNGGNSGICALNLAYQMRPKRIFLCGFDMSRGPNGECYWYADYAWSPGGATSNTRYAEWAKQFDTAAEAFEKIGTAVFNATPSKAIKVFPRITPKQLESEF